MTAPLDGYNGGVPICDYRIELVAGSVVVASTNDNGLGQGDPSPAADAWTTASLTFSPSNDHPQLGQPLEIRLIAVDFDTYCELNFDDVKLDAYADSISDLSCFVANIFIYLSLFVNNLLHVFAFKY
jgi:hypothetical protein